ncbi:MAG: hypothetical protein ACK5PB_14170 [Pirellula sp.]
MMKHTGNVLGRTATLLVKSRLLTGSRFRSQGNKVCGIALSMAMGFSILSGCANTSGYNGQPCYPYNAYPYAPQPQYVAPGTFQPGGVYPGTSAAAPMVPNTGAPIGSPVNAPGGTYPAGMAPAPGYNNMPAYNGQPGSGPGQPFIGS